MYCRIIVALGVGMDHKPCLGAVGAEGRPCTLSWRMQLDKRVAVFFQLEEALSAYPRTVRRSQGVNRRGHWGEGTSLLYYRAAVIFREIDGCGKSALAVNNLHFGLFSTFGCHSEQNPANHFPDKKGYFPKRDPCILRYMVGRDRYIDIFTVSAGRDRDITLCTGSVWTEAAFHFLHGIEGSSRVPSNPA